MEILIPIITLGVLGLLFGVGLAIASKQLAVEVDPRLDKIRNILPGSNCGACGKAGCSGFAESLMEGQADINACRVSTDTIKEGIAQILGKKLEKKVKNIAVLHCNGGRKVKDKFLYHGLTDCVSANLVLCGQKECVYGCLGFGTCVEICPFGAIKMGNAGLPVIDEKKCRACNKCIEVCPKKLFSLIPVTAKVDIACISHDSGKNTKTVCPVGCIACKLCEKTCKFNAIHIIDNLAVIDYQKCTSCGECAKVCPAKTIHQR
ncbi:MAG: RnfABCDGE type electron transport complex subunit B [Candidatus Omnitrophota bacterium]